jgi:hypothetical protein
VTLTENTGEPETEGARASGATAGASADETMSIRAASGALRPSASSIGAPDAAPDRIGRYRIVRRLGQGGFWRVYLAHDDDLNRKVAIKLPNAERTLHPEDLQAFLTEARILASLDHPRIAPVHDVGRTEEGLCLLGNVLESCQEDPGVFRANWLPTSVDHFRIDMYAPIHATVYRVLRGGGFSFRADQARSAATNAYQPESRFYGDGVRPVRTLP